MLYFEKLSWNELRKDGKQLQIGFQWQNGVQKYDLLK